VADEPPAGLVDRLSKTFLATDGDIKAVLRALVGSPEFQSKLYFRNKVKTPMEFLVSAFRMTGTDPVNPQALVNTVRNMGMPLYFALPPTGYSITAEHWMNTGALVERLNFAYQLTNNKFYNQRFDSGHVLGLGLLAQPAGAEAGRPRYAEAVSRTAVPVEETGGADVILGVLERTLVGGAVSARTRALLHTQLAGQPANANPNDTLSLITALVMGSPEFQVR
jgi:hypothetical protein